MQFLFISTLLSIVLFGNDTHALPNNAYWVNLVTCKASKDDLVKLTNKTEFFQKKRIDDIGLTKSQNTVFAIEIYNTDQPISIVGYQTNKIAFIDDGLFVKLNEPNTQKLANELKIPTVLNLPQKFMGKKIVNKSEKTQTDSFVFWEEISLNISNVSTLPNKTLFGCNYKKQVNLL